MRHRDAKFPQTYLPNSPTFADGDSVKMRSLLFVDSNYRNANYQPPDPGAFFMVAESHLQVESHCHAANSRYFSNNLHCRSR
jgi:hypothetical protein